MKKTCLSPLIFFFSVFFFFQFTSCVSKPVPIPGEKKKAIANIYIEYMNIGDTYYSLEKYDKALEYYKLSMQSSDLYWASYYKTAKVYAIQANWNAALPMYRRLLRREKDNDTIKASIAYIFAMTGKLEKAKKAYKELVYLQPDNQEYLENLIAVLFAKEENNEAKGYLSLLVEKFPDSENISKFNELIKKIDDEDSKEVDIYSSDDEKSVFDQDLEENPDPEELVTGDPRAPAPVPEELPAGS